ncbi:MAG: translation initiation factor IF-2 [Patescibacteria group bacterium]|jgi:translation initiation factor IF-2
MNVTELARRLKIPTDSLRDLIPDLGFDVGKKAIKVDDRVAQQIIKKIKSQPNLLEDMRKKKLAAVKTEEKAVAGADTSRPLQLPQQIAVRDFADMLKMPVTQVVKELMNSGILASLNEQIDFETASIIAEDLGFATELTKKAETHAEATIESLVASDTEEHLVERPPVVVVMGHVDHGKTKLLDAIRKTNVVEGEAGGITQHIGAYQVVYKKRGLTFIDTPGHEAFTTMRSRGARVADIAILVVAADEGIKPQTQEAITIIQNSELPFIVAINKIDKEGANIERIKQQLAEKNLLPEDWGGKVITVPISAKQNKGIPELLDTVILVADMEKDNIRANPDRAAVGTIIESRVSKAEGPIATVLVQSGTLRTGDLVSVGGIGGKVKTMKDFRGQDVREAVPSTPVKILGLKTASAVGDILQVQQDVKALKKTLKEHELHKMKYRASFDARTGDDDERIQKMPIILKSDTLGSQEAILQALETLELPDFKITVIKKGLGNITESDLESAQATHAIVYGFHVQMTPPIAQIASEQNLPVKMYDIIYELIQDVKQEGEKILVPEIVRTEEGRVKVLAIFRTEKKHMIVGGTVTKGRAIVNAQVNILRGVEQMGTGKITGLQAGKQNVKEVLANQECGLSYEGSVVIQIGDFLDIFTEVKRYRKLAGKE